MYLTNATPNKHPNPDRPVKQKASYLLALFAGFLGAFFTLGSGGVASMRRSTSSVLGGGGLRSRFMVGD